MVKRFSKTFRAGGPAHVISVRVNVNSIFSRRSTSRGIADHLVRASPVCITYASRVCITCVYHVCVSCVCIMCLHYVYVSRGCIMCLHYVYVSHVFITCVPHVCVSRVFLHLVFAPRSCLAFLYLGNDIPIVDYILERTQKSLNQ